MSDAWEEIQAIKSKRNSLREKLQKRKKERLDILNLNSGSESPTSVSAGRNLLADIGDVSSPSKTKSHSDEVDSLENRSVLESQLLRLLCDSLLTLPISSSDLLGTVNRKNNANYPLQSVVSLLNKFSTQQLIGVSELGGTVEVVSAEHVKLVAMINDLEDLKQSAADRRSIGERSPFQHGDDCRDEPVPKAAKIIDKEEKKREKKTSDILSLLSMPSIREKETKKVGEEILELLSKPTVKERSLAERFRSNGAQVMEFCAHGTRDDCLKLGGGGQSCSKLHFKKIIQKHTDESLGDCSFLNTCFHMDTCKYVHYEVDSITVPVANKNSSSVMEAQVLCDKTILYPPQWIQCDLRYLDMTVLGKFAVIMADPPWDIHMELPYGTMSDDEMRHLGVPALQDNGLIFLWVTGRAMELGRECLQLWGYERMDELIWVKTNQLQRIIRTGRTGHWLNHGKEHCLVGCKGDISHINRGLDCDVIVAEVRATSHKPDEIYGIIERLSPGTRKIELFGRPHNIQPNWITLGNQVDGVKIIDPDLIKAFKKRYPDGNCMAPPKS